MVFFIFYLAVSLISIKIYLHFHFQQHIHCFSFSTLPNFLLYSLSIHESWATTNFHSTISQIPLSLIYKISFTIFFSFCSLSPLYSISYTESTWFGLVHLRVKHYCFVQHLSLLDLYFGVTDSLKVSPIQSRYRRFNLSFTNSLKVLPILQLSKGFINSSFL